MSNSQKNFTPRDSLSIIPFMNGERIIVSKFGGSSMANAQSIGLVIGIVEADPKRRVIVVSAPGVDANHSMKVTDLLLQRRFDEVRDRFHQMGRDLGWRQRDQRITAVMDDLSEKDFRDYRASRGEYLTARMLADLIGSEFVDAREIIHVSGDRKVNDTSDEAIRSRLMGKSTRVIVPGFYGENWKGWIRTMERNASDVTGAVAARSLRASIYELFSDTAVMTADPRLDPNAALISYMTFADLPILSQSGAKIIHPDVASILQGTGVMIHCLNTFAPDHPGTWISD